METVKRSASDDEILRLVRKWVDVLALGDFEKVFDALGYAVAYQEGMPGSEVIRKKDRGVPVSRLLP